MPELNTTVVVGTQWGDEGKGKITDYLAERSQIVARYQGGNNAGHTIVFGGTKYKLHLVPSGIFYPDKICVLGNGMVIDPGALLQELVYLRQYGITGENLRISDRAHLIMPYHLLLDKAYEEAKTKSGNKIGTTGKGIGPAYTDKAARTGIRMIDLLDPEHFAKKLRQNLEYKNQILSQIYRQEPLDFEETYQTYMGYAEQLREHICDTSFLLNQAIDQGKSVLFEGAQGVMLDIDHGTYPYVTSSSPSAGGVCIGAGVGPTKIGRVVGVAKAYTTRVGDGPFPTELQNEIGERIREIGKEYGTTTGRPRRVGWFDSVVVRHSCRVSGLTGLSLNSLDVLSGLDSVKICTSYRYRDQVLENYPANLSVLAECEPVYEEFEGWSEDITGVQALTELPKNVRTYLEAISRLTGVPVMIFSVGPGREQTVYLPEFLEARS